MELLALLLLVQNSHGLLGALSYPGWVWLGAGLLAGFLKLEQVLPERIEPCSGDLLCNRTGRRHKRGCPGSTINVRDYARRVINA